jgi:hypothetical protein
MRSDNQKETSRRNGAKSRGPVSDAGKQRSSQNALKHGICSKALLIPGESADDLDRHFAAYRTRFQPIDPVEGDLVDNLAFIAWRQRRLWRKEAELITEKTRSQFKQSSDADVEHQCASQAWSWLPDSTVALLQREETNLRRAYDRTLKNLRELQDMRPEPQPPEADAKMQNEPEPELTASLTNALQAHPMTRPAAPPLSENGIGTVSPPQPLPTEAVR